MGNQAEPQTSVFQPGNHLEPQTSVFQPEALTSVYTNVGSPTSSPGGGCSDIASRNLHRLYTTNLDLNGSTDMTNYEDVDLSRQCSISSIRKLCYDCESAAQGRYAAHTAVVMMFDAHELLGGANSPSAAALQALTADINSCFSAFLHNNTPFTPLFLATKVDMIRRLNPNFSFEGFARTVAESVSNANQSAPVVVGEDGEPEPSPLIIEANQIMEMRGIGTKSEWASLLAQRDWEYVRSLYSKVFSAIMPVAASNMRRTKPAFCECVSLCC
jgi:hypothetical protein